MNDALASYHALHDSGRQVAWADEPDAARAMGAVMDLVARQGSLEMGAPCRPHRREERALLTQAGFAPEGGWGALVGLMADGPSLKADGERFVAACDVEEFRARGGADHRRHLAEALSMNLVPPTTLAGLLLLMGLHPLWGLRVASSIQGDEHHGSSALRDTTLFPDEVLVAVRDGIFLALGALLEALASLKAGMAYDVGALAALVARAATFGQDTIRHELPGDLGGALGVFVPEIEKHLPSLGARALDFTLTELMEEFLVPAHIATRHDVDSFCVLPGALAPDVRVRVFGRLGEAGCLARLLGVGARVAKH